MTSPPFLSVSWRDHVSGRPGYLVIDRLVRGVASGGLRMREGCTLDEVHGLARGMTLKEALHYEPDARYIPLGGAKGGIDCSPHDPDARAVLTRYLRAMRPYVERFWTTGEDLGLSQPLIDEVVAELGMRSSIEAVYPLLDDEDVARKRLAEAFAIEVDGIGLGELVGGCGVAESALAVLDRDGFAPRDARAVVQGFGTMGGATARFLAQAGVRVVGVADARGLVTNPSGLDVEALLRARSGLGVIDRSALRPTDRELPGEEWLALDAEILVPAAVSYAVDEQNQTRIAARYLVEAANLPVVPAAEAALAARGVTVLPDVVVNSGTNAWWWWTLFGDIEADAGQAFAKVRASMRRLVGETLTRSEIGGITPRAAAWAVAEDRLPQIEARFGWYR